jgi:flagellum-specific ATP synthase
VLAAGQALRALLAAHRDKRDLIAIGAYERGSDPLTDRAIELHGSIEAFLRQPVDEHTSADEADRRLVDLVAAPLAASVEEPVALADAPPAPATRDPGLSAIPPLHLGVR